VDSSSLWDEFVLVREALEENFLDDKSAGFQLESGEIRDANALAHLEYLLPFFWLEPGPDPFRVFASKRQAAKPIATLFALRLEIT